MLELVFVWIVSALALGFVGTLMVLMARNLLSALGRLVFVEPDQAETV